MGGSIRQPSASISVSASRSRKVCSAPSGAAGCSCTVCFITVHQLHTAMPVAAASGAGEPEQQQRGYSADQVAECEDNDQCHITSSMVSVIAALAVLA